MAGRVAKAVGFDYFGVLEAYSPSGGLAFNPAVLAIAARIHRAGLKTAILTSAGHSVVRELKASPDVANFDHIFSVIDIGAPKPSLQALMRLSHRLGVEPSELIFIDDAPIHIGQHSNLNQFGITYIQYENVPQLMEQLQIAGLGPELLSN